MAIVTRYFSTTGAGAADGTTWADRAALFSAGNWSTVITGFAFNASDALECRVEGGLTYTCGQSLAAGLFANPPTIVNPIIFYGCDNAGARLAIPDPDWVSAQPAFTDTTLPVLNSTTNIATFALGNTYLRLLKVTASGRNGAIITTANTLQWCVVENSTANTAALAASINVVVLSNSVLTCSGSSYSAVLAVSNSSAVDNVRIVGNAGSSGNRDGFTFTGTVTRSLFTRMTIINNGGRGWVYTGTNVGINVVITASTFANNAGDQVVFPNTAAQTSYNVLSRCMITGGGAIGVNPGGANTNLLVTQCRVRDHTTSNFGTFGNFPTDLTNFTTDSDDATEYVNVAGGDFRIKNTAAIWGQGYGAADEPVPQSRAGFSLGVI